jgi:hypothetical protein
MAGFLGCEYAGTLLGNPPQKDPPKEEPEEPEEPTLEVPEQPGNPGGVEVNASSFSNATGEDNRSSAIDEIWAAKAATNTSVTITLTAGAETVSFAQDKDLGTTGLVLKNNTSPVSVTIDGGKRVVDLVGENSTSNPRPLITVGTGVTLTLRNITLKGLKSGNTGDNNNNTWSLIWVENGGTLILETGASIKDNALSLYDGTVGAGGVTVYGTLIMNGGEIRGNSTLKLRNHGGGVYVGNGGTFTMKGGTISGNTVIRNYTTTRGGGVYVSNGGAFTMEGGTISGNSSCFGGGVGVWNGTFTMKGGTISGNTARDNGGGVWIIKENAANAVFTMIGGTIRANNAVNGAGVDVDAGSTFNMYNGTIEDHNVNSDGGGVYVFAGTFKMYGGTIKNNTTLPSGGGVHIRDSSTFIMEDGTISGNSGWSGGGVYVQKGSTFTMNGGTISGNKAANIYGGGFGGGVAVRDGTFKMTNGIISGNAATYALWKGDGPWGDISGGGVAVGLDNTTGAFTMSGGTISGNTAKNGGGVLVSSTGTFTKTGGIIYGSDVSADLKNTSTSAGYGNAVYAFGINKVLNTTAWEGDNLKSDGTVGTWVTPSAQ